jgi:hypothetical protein
MEELDLSRPGTELFPESVDANNSYQGVIQEPVAEVPQDTGVYQPEAAAQGQLSDKEMNFRAIREELAKLKEEREYWKGQADAFIKAPNLRQEPPSHQEQYNPLNDIDDDDWAKGKSVKQAFEYQEQKLQRLKTELDDKLAAFESKSSHQDWNQQVTQHVPQLTSKNPLFAEMIQKVSNPYEAAYLLAELNARASAVQQPQMSSDAQRAIANAQKPQSVATVGGRGKLSEADLYASMSDEDFMKLAARNLASI